MKYKAAKRPKTIAIATVQYFRQIGLNRCPTLRQRVFLRLGCFNRALILRIGREPRFAGLEMIP